MSVLAETFLQSTEPPSEGEPLPEVIERDKPTGGPANSGISLGVSNDESFKDTEPLIIQSMINNSSVYLQGVVSNVSLGWSSNWQEEVVYGRLDPIPTYSNTTRTVSITVQLVTPAGSSKIKKLSLAKAKLEKLNVLANMCYPGYDFNAENNNSFNTGILKAAPLVKIKYGNVITGNLTGVEPKMLLGYIKSLNVDFQADGMFAIGVSSSNQDEKYFQKISVSLEFGVLHTHNVGTDVDGDSLVNAYGDNKTLTAETIRYPFNFGDDDE
tara:strand:+ start:1102 stop:1908 length:807 start_codon:yes stop_codon:yes gene_type:complete